MDATKQVGAEDLEVGEYITPVFEKHQFPSYLWDGDSTSASTPIEVTVRPKNAGIPYKIIEICVPFILGKCPKGKLQRFDLRGMDIGKVSRKYAKTYKKSRRRKHANPEIP